MNQVKTTACALALILTSLGASAEYTASNESGVVAFSGVHAGMAFEGEFLAWTATLSLPPAEQVYVNADFDLSTATTGDSTYDETLPEGDWFDVKNHPVGQFRSTEVRKVDNGYEVIGSLTLRGISEPVQFDLTPQNGRLKAEFDISRLDYNIGMESDPSADWVGELISLKLNIPQG